MGEGSAPRARPTETLIAGHSALLASTPRSTTRLLRRPGLRRVPGRGAEEVAVGLLPTRLWGFVPGPLASPPSTLQGFPGKGTSDGAGVAVSSCSRPPRRRMPPAPAWKGTRVARSLLRADSLPAADRPEPSRVRAWDRGRAEHSGCLGPEAASCSLVGWFPFLLFLINVLFPSDLGLRPHAPSALACA